LPITVALAGYGCGAEILRLYLVGSGVNTALDHMCATAAERLAAS